MRKVDHFATIPSGIPGIDDLRWGSHICQWYCKRGDLADTLVPYFEAGLQNNERCIWVTAPPYEMADAKHDLERTVAGLDQMIADRQLRIFDAGNWYVNGNSLRGINVIEHWLVEEREALAAGYNGIRIAANTSFVSEDDWRIFIEYENGFNRELLHEHRIVALCSYNLLDVTPAKMFDAVHSHQVTIHKAGTDWKVLES
jgi:hypothetical protein